jgi:hypothetical protein
MCRSSETPFERIRSALREASAWLAALPAGELGPALIEGRELINRTEALLAEPTRRFEKARAYEADGALGMVDWMREHQKLSGGQAAQRVEVARQLAELPRTEEALARGEIGYEHAVAMAKTASNVGAAEVRKAEVRLLKQAESMDPGQFVTVAKSFEHQVDAAAALSEANRAHERRYFRIGAPSNGLVRLEGQVTTEQGAVIRSAIEPFMKPSKGDERTPDQRGADSLTEVCRRVSGAAPGNGVAPRVQLIIKASIDTLTRTAGASAGELEWGGTIPADSVRRLACDAAITRIKDLGELDWETTHAARTIPPATRRALVARDRHCVFPGCDRPPPWCDGHHLVFWADGGPTKLENLGLVCKPHHRKVHEEGWTLRREGGRWRATPPPLKIAPRARSA